MPLHREVHEVAKLEAEQRSIMTRWKWPVTLMEFVAVDPADVDRLREIQRLLRLPRMTRCSGGTDGITQTEIVVDRIERPETASELWQRLNPDSRPVGVDDLGIDEAPRPAFKVGDVVQLKSGGPLMTVVNADCVNCLDLAHDLRGSVDVIRLPRAAVAEYIPF